MNKFTVLLVSMALVVMTSVAWATPITFTPDVSGSSVTVTDTARFANITASLVLGSTPFILGDGATQTLDFFTLTASGLFAVNQNYTVAATLNFLDPLVAGSGSGGGKFSTFFGVLSGGTLTWDTTTLPDTFLLADGNTIRIDFQNGSTIGLGNTALVHAYVTNLGGGVAPVPEPGTIVLLGAGLLGLGFFGKRRMNKA